MAADCETPRLRLQAGGGCRSVRRRLSSSDKPAVNARQGRLGRLGAPLDPLPRRLTAGLRYLDQMATALPRLQSGQLTFDDVPFARMLEQIARLDVLLLDEVGHHQVVSHVES